MRGRPKQQQEDDREDGRLTVDQGPGLGRGRDLLLDRLFEVHGAPRYDIAPEILAATSR